MAVFLGSELIKVKEKAKETVDALNTIIQNIEEIEKLSSKDNIIFDLRSKGVSYSQIGQVVGLSGTAVRNRFQKIIDKGETIDLWMEKKSS